MKTKIQFKLLVVLVALCATLSAFAPMPGAHNFQVYLDDKLIIEQYARKDMIAPKITIDPAENHKQIVVKYNECNRTVSGRVLTIKDEKDNVLKELKFDGSTAGLKDPMTYNVKDILSLKANNLKLVYSSTDFPDGQQVATLVIGPGKNTALN